MPVRVDSVISQLSGETSFFRRASSFFLSKGNLLDPSKEFLASFQFQWKRISFWRTVMECDQLSLPPVLMPYLRPQHWQLFLNALQRLAARNHFVGTIYIFLGIWAILAGIAYVLYGAIPMDYEKFCSMEIALGSGVALLIVGVCLCAWGRANRAGGVVFESDLENMCENMSQQVPGLQVQFKSPSTMVPKEGKAEDASKDPKPIFGVELFCIEDVTESTAGTGQSYLMPESDAAAFGSADFSYMSGLTSVPEDMA